jgi:hypothetical protein
MARLLDWIKQHPQGYQIVQFGVHGVAKVAVSCALTIAATASR